MRPDEVLVLYNASYAGDENANGVQDSLETALYYAMSRSVPLAEPWHARVDDGALGTVVEVAVPSSPQALWRDGLTDTSGGALPGTARALVDAANSLLGVEGGLLGIEGLPGRYAPLFATRLPVGDLSLVTDGDPATMPAPATVASILDQCRTALDRPLPSSYPARGSGEDYRTRVLYLVLTTGMPLRTSVDFYGGIQTSLDTCLAWVNEVDEVLASTDPDFSVTNPPPGPALGTATSLREHRDTPTAPHRMMTFAGRVDGHRTTEALRLVDAALWAEAHLSRARLTQPQLVVTANTSGGYPNFFTRYQSTLEPEFSLVRRPTPVDAWEAIHVTDGGLGYRNGNPGEGPWPGEWLPGDLNVADFGRGGPGRTASRYLPGSLAVDRNSEPGYDFKLATHYLPLRELRGVPMAFVQTAYTFDLALLEGATIMWPTLAEPYLSGFPGPPEYLVEFLGQRQDVAWCFHRTFGEDPVSGQLGLPHPTFQLGDPLYRLDGSQVDDTRAPAIVGTVRVDDLGGDPGHCVRLRWITDTLATSEASLVGAAGLEQRVADLRPSRVHLLDVPGLLADVPYTILVKSVVPDASAATVREAVVPVPVRLGRAAPAEGLVPGPIAAGQVVTTAPGTASGSSGRVSFEMEITGGVSAAFDVLRSGDIRVRATPFFSGLQHAVAVPGGVVGYDPVAMALRRLDLLESPPLDATGSMRSILARETLERLSGVIVFDVADLAADASGLVHVAEAAGRSVLTIRSDGTGAARTIDEAALAAVGGAAGASPRSIAVDATGRLVVFESASGALLAFDAAGGGSVLVGATELLAATGEASVDLVALVAGGDTAVSGRVVGLDATGPGHVVIVDVSAGAATVRIVANPAGAFAAGAEACLLSDGRVAVLARSSADELHVIDPSGGPPETWADRADLDAVGVVADPVAGARVASADAVQALWRVPGMGVVDPLLARADLTGYAFLLQYTTAFGGHSLTRGPRLVLEQGDRVAFDVAWSERPVMRRLRAHPVRASGAAESVNGREVIDEARTPWDPGTFIATDAARAPQWSTTGPAGAFVLRDFRARSRPDFDHLLDTDGDGILDRDEVRRDPATAMPEDADGDLYLNRADVDSDDDGIPDDEEAGDPDPRTPPIDTDADGMPDFLDVDSDEDGIPDAVDACRLNSAPDLDADGLCPPDDNCELASNPDQVDRDGDGAGDACDCAVDDATNPAPAAVADLRVMRPASLAWTGPADGAGASRGNVISGEIGRLRPDAGTMAGTCLAGDLSAPAFDDMRPLPGRASDGCWYVVVARGACGDGPALPDSFGRARSLAACP